MRSRGLVPNRGGGQARRRPAQGRAVYTFEGPLRFVDRHGARAAMRVEGGNAAGRRFLGRTVTLDLSSARISTADRDRDGTISAADLLSGERVTFSVRLASRLEEPPPVLVVSRLTACHAAAAL